MSQVKEIDVRGLSCPEPVMITSAALKKYKGQDIKVLISEAHVSTNIQKLLKKNKIDYVAAEDGEEFVITFKA